MGACEERDAGVNCVFLGVLETRQRRGVGGYDGKSKKGVEGEKWERKKGGLLAGNGCLRRWQRGAYSVHVDDEFSHYRRYCDLLRLAQVYSQVPVDFS